ncbi:MAG: hypothetical protein AMJ93_15030 [Anaerolineae bacterium SM23_84]|nr:MAG: hypothetical protein AMJ93_15030 [Anaerolineae bacterium SM23_84]
MSRDTMYKLFDELGLDERRGSRHNTQPPDGLCPSFGKFNVSDEGLFFCAFCPCPVPDCAAGHGGAEHQEWECLTCTLRESCACWDSERRSQHGWEPTYQKWLADRRKRMKTIVRMRKAARQVVAEPDHHATVRHGRIRLK